MKNIIIIIISMTYINAYACEREISNNFTFNYAIKNNFFSYEVKRKDNKVFSSYRHIYRDMPGEIGFIVEENVINSPQISDHKQLNSEQKKAKQFNEFYSENEKLYSSMLYREMEGYYETRPTKGDFLAAVYFKDTTNLKNSVDLKKMFKFFAYKMPENYKYGVKKIKFKVKLILDPNLKECLSFETPVLDYDFGNESWYRFKNFLR